MLRCDLLTAHLVPSIQPIGLVQSYLFHSDQFYQKVLKVSPAPAVVLSTIVKNVDLLSFFEFCSSPNGATKKEARELQPLQKFEIFSKLMYENR